MKLYNRWVFFFYFRTGWGNGSVNTVLTTQAQGTEFRSQHLPKKLGAVSMPGRAERGGSYSSLAASLTQSLRSAKLCLKGQLGSK